MVAKCYAIVTEVIHEFGNIREGDVLCMMVNLDSNKNMIGILNTRNKVIIYEPDMQRLNLCFKLEQID